MNIAIGIVLIVMSLFIVVAVLMQNGKSHGLSGAIAGGAETFFGKNKGGSLDAVLSKVTTIVSVVFVILVVVAYIIQGNIADAASGNKPSPADTAAAADTTVAGETEAPADTTASEETEAPEASSEETEEAAE